MIQKEALWIKHLQRPDVTWVNHINQRTVNTHASFENRSFWWKDSVRYRDHFTGITAEAGNAATIMISNNDVWNMFHTLGSNFLAFSFA